MFRALNPSGANSPRDISEVVNNLMNGKGNNTGSITLSTGGATTTTINDERIGFGSVIALTPKSLSASAVYLPFGAFHDTTTQTISSTTTAYPMALNTTDFTDGVSITSSSRITVEYAGVYNLLFSSQFLNSDTQIHDISIWMSHNGTNIPASNGEFSVPNRHGSKDGALIAAFNLFEAMEAGDYLEIMWAATNTSVSMPTIAAASSPTRPVTPSVIATLNYISFNGLTNNIPGTPYVSSLAKGSATISHPSNEISGKSYDYTIIG